ncbi:unannotated protein [freshwater metagenome]|uniref:Unannotated protein n=1 Tax=freshwater metagenome TaxID=449393 RepID=A0A6J6WFN3_9ZZZZ
MEELLYDVNATEAVCAPVRLMVARTISPFAPTETGPVDGPFKPLNETNTTSPALGLDGEFERVIVSVKVLVVVAVAPATVLFRNNAPGNDTEVGP